MSLILDALRRGRARSQWVPQIKPNIAKTAAVLQTLGYRPIRPAYEVERFKRITGYLAAVIVSALVLWVAVGWIVE